MISINRLTGFYIAIILLFSALQPIQAQIRDSISYQPFFESKFSVRTINDSLFQLDHQFVNPYSEVILLDTFILRREVDYTINYRYGKFTLHPQVAVFSLPDSLPHEIRVRYQALPFHFKEKYSIREPIVRSDSAKEWIVKVKPIKPFFIDDLFRSDMQANGSLLRGISVGTNRDLTLNSGFRLQMAGNLSDDIRLTAALTDENTPIQPEGVTQTLREIDKVFIEAKGTRFSGTLGDFSLNMTGSEFGTFTRKLQGAKGIYSYSLGRGTGDVIISAATARGKYTSNEFLGIDGIQGPYQLSGESGERAIIVVAGTERVYINGIRLERGENADYTIDYANAQVTFTPKRILTNATRIVIDFEYNDRQFNRNLSAVKVTNNLFSEHWQLEAMIAQERDDKDATVDLSLTDTDKEILRNAGNDRTLARKSGAEYVGPGKGQYIRLDTLISRQGQSDTLLQIYRFQPEDTINAVYIVTFSFVSKGNYRKVAAGRYEFSGLLTGNYEPVTFLPMPQSNMLMDFNLNGNISNNLTISGEYASSSLDQNTFSSIGDGKNVDHAFKFIASYNPKSVRIGGLDLGSLDIILKERFTGSQFKSLGRVNEIDFNRNWNLQDTTAGDEEIREMTMTYSPSQVLSFGGGYGFMQRGGAFQSVRYSGNGMLKSATLPVVEYSLEKISTTNSITETKGDWIRHRGRTEYVKGIFTPRFNIFFEDLENHGNDVDTLIAGSYRYQEILPGISVGDASKLLLTGEIGFRRDDSLAQGSVQRASVSVSHHYGLQFHGWRSLSSTLDLIVSNRSFTDLFKGRGNENLHSTLVRSQTRFNPLEKGIESDWFYEVTTGRTSKYDRIFQRVPIGTGNYVYRGDVNGNNIVDYPDFQLSRFDGDYILVSVPTGEFVPSVDLKTSGRVHVNFNGFIKPSGLIGSMLAPLSLETYARVEEQTGEPDRSKIYFLYFSRFLSDLHTIAGSNLITQDVNIHENDPGWSVRFRYNQRKGLIQYALSKDRTYFREQSARLRWRLVEGIVNQTDIFFKRDILSTDQQSMRNRSIISQEITTDWSYRPEQRLEIGFRLTLRNADNYDSVTENDNDQAIRLVYSFNGRGQLSAELTREDVVVNKFSINLPYELTDGKSIGKNWLWRMNGEYRLSELLQLSAQYDGRSENGRSPVHTAKMELRAFF
jgi:hypothetical protein